MMTESESTTLAQILRGMGADRHAAAAVGAIVAFVELRARREALEAAVDAVQREAALWMSKDATAGDVAYACLNTVRPLLKKAEEAQMTFAKKIAEAEKGS